jgi:hypothetical protein
MPAQRRRCVRRAFAAGASPPFWQPAALRIAPPAQRYARYKNPLPKVPLGYDAVARKRVVNEDEAARVRRVLEIFAETGSGIATVARLRAAGATRKAGRPLDTCDVFKQPDNRTYVGEAAYIPAPQRGAPFGRDGL